MHEVIIAVYNDITDVRNILFLDWDFETENAINMRYFGSQYQPLKANTSAWIQILVLWSSILIKPHLDTRKSESICPWHF
jgi:hypothetical protein